MGPDQLSFPIGATTTRTGLTVHAELDEGTYPSGIKVTDREMKALHPSSSPTPRRLELRLLPTSRGGKDVITQQ